VDTGSWHDRDVTFGQRFVGVLRLDAATFEDIEADQTATTQALGVVLLASVAAGVGAGLLLGAAPLLRGVLAAIVGWVMWAGVIYVLGARLLPEPQTRTDMGELLRVIGFSYAPNCFAILAFVPAAGAVVQVIVAFWLLAAMIIAVRQALDYQSTARAVGVVLSGWLFFVLIQVLLA
jgi:hypothetical protein